MRRDGNGTHSQNRWVLYEGTGSFCCGPKGQGGGEAVARAGIFKVEMALLTSLRKSEGRAPGGTMGGANEYFARVKLRKREALARNGYPRLTAWASLCRAYGAGSGGNQQSHLELWI